MPNSRHRDAPPPFDSKKRGEGVRRLRGQVPDAVRGHVEGYVSFLQCQPEDRSFQEDLLVLLRSEPCRGWIAKIEQKGFSPGDAEATITSLFCSVIWGRGRDLIGKYFISLGQEVVKTISWGLHNAGLEFVQEGNARQDFQETVVAQIWLFLWLTIVRAGEARDILDGFAGHFISRNGWPFGWAPGIDPLRPILRFLLVGQVPGKFLSGGLLSSPLAQQLCGNGYTEIRQLVQYFCPHCGWKGRSDWRSPLCPNCGIELKERKVRRLLASTMRLYHHGEPNIGEVEIEIEGDTEDPEPVAVAIQKEYSCRVGAQARALWKEVQSKCRLGKPVPAAVLAYLAGTQIMATGLPEPSDRHIDRLVNTLASPYVDIKNVLKNVRAQVSAFNGISGRPTPLEITRNYVAVIISRFRRFLFEPFRAED